MPLTNLNSPLNFRVNLAKFALRNRLLFQNREETKPSLRHRFRTKTNWWTTPDYLENSKTPANQKTRISCDTRSTPPWGKAMNEHVSIDWVETDTLLLSLSQQSPTWLGQGDMVGRKQDLVTNHLRVDKNSASQSRTIYKEEQYSPPLALNKYE